MPYDSPKQIRRRQRQAESKVSRPRRQQPIKVSSDELSGRACSDMLFSMNALIWQGHADSAGRCARALVTMAVQRRACQVMVETGLRSAWKAMDIARHELLNGEVA
jgi:hypothetical protein